MIWLGTGAAADYLGRDVTGKAVVIQDFLTPGVLNHSVNYDQTVARAYEKGAAAVGIVYGIADNYAVWEGTRGRPGFQIGYEDGKVLRELLGQGQPVKLKYRVDSEMRPGLKSASVWGSLKGTGDEDVLVIAHLDAYFEGAIDNSSGLAVMMGLAEHFSKVPAVRAAAHDSLPRLGRPPRRPGHALAARQPRRPSSRRPRSSSTSSTSRRCGRSTGARSCG